MFLDNKVADMSVWELAITMIIINLVIGMLIHFVTKNT